MIPAPDPSTGYLPFTSEIPIPASLEDICERFVTNARRAHLWEVFGLWLHALDEAQLPGALRLGGSFITAKPEPGDVDVAVAVPQGSASGAWGIVISHPHLWTWQHVGLLRDGVAGPDWRYLAARIQPALGRVDSHYFEVETAIAVAFARDWTSEYTDDGTPTGVRKGWLEVSR